ncbi:MAG: DUF2974 domain-containing protein [Rhodospirillaceae bacterium]|nr:DUF2974 domain-containing protein [Rhodospirillaceae bacterium]
MDCVDYAMLAQDAYEDEETLRMVTQADWTRVWRTSDMTTGFACSLYRYKRTGNHVLSFRGTNPTQWGDLVADIGIGVRQLTPQFVLALASYGTAAVQAGDDSHIIGLCGHSLGGALAKFVGAHQGKLAYSFNGPGVAGMGGVTRQTDHGDIRNVNAAGDVVSKYGATLGRTVSVSVSSMNYVPDCIEGVVAASAGLLAAGNYLLSQHSISNLRYALETLKPDQRPFAGS